jgi:predicted RNase H-like nuclease (RuvC/YqgF family)
MFHGEDNINNINNINNLDNFAAQSQNEMLLQTQIMNLENDTMLANKTLQQLENENDQLKAQLMKNQEKMESKEGINNEFKQLFGAFKQRFAQYEKRNDFFAKIYI